MKNTKKDPKEKTLYRFKGSGQGRCGEVFDIMDTHGGVRSRCFELNDQNINFILA